LFYTVAVDSTAISLQDENASLREQIAALDDHVADYNAQIVHTREQVTARVKRIRQLEELIHTLRHKQVVAPRIAASIAEKSSRH
jgi:peptidoglycan hydrolase CwlO-like protein